VNVHAKRPVLTIHRTCTYWGSTSSNCRKWLVEQQSKILATVVKVKSC